MTLKIITALALAQLCIVICCAQSGGGSQLPRVRRLRSDQPASSGKDGCDNHPLTFHKDGDDYFFDSHDDGRDAWMNLDGKNVRLTLLRSVLVYTDEFGTANATYEYRDKRTLITVKLPFYSDYTNSVPATVRLRRDGSMRTYKAFVAAQCDAL
jgi:hypothetical protein